MGDQQERIWARFVIRAKGPGLNREFKGTATIRSGQASPALILMGMLNQIITKDGLRGETNIVARISLIKSTKGDRHG